MVGERKKLLDDCADEYDDGGESERERERRKIKRKLKLEVDEANFQTVWEKKIELIFKRNEITAKFVKLVWFLFSKGEEKWGFCLRDFVLELIERWRLFYKLMSKFYKLIKIFFNLILSPFEFQISSQGKVMPN